MIVNLDVVDVYTSYKKRRKHPEKRKKQPTENQNNTKYQNVT